MGMELEALGWNDWFEQHSREHTQRGLGVGRVVADHGKLYRVHAPDAERVAEASGRLRHAARGGDEHPVTGDWVVFDEPPKSPHAVIRAVLPRRSQIHRRAAGARTTRQVLAANMDWLMIVMGLDGDYNLRRLERYLLLAWESGANPLIVLNKTDLCGSPRARVSEVEEAATGTPVVALSARSGDGLEPIRSRLRGGQTAAFLGSSGVGKSTLINRLLGHERQPTADVRASDDRGRHTTTYRELIPVPGGGLVIDTPGLRELQLWAEGKGLERTFADIESLAAGCAFRDCSHQREPRCAVRAAVDAGELDGSRFASYLKLQAELHHAAVRQDQGLRLDEKQKWRAIHKAARKFRPKN
jgi:ribosome biogenesis GTPase